MPSNQDFARVVETSGWNYVYVGEIKLLPTFAFADEAHQMAAQINAAFRAELDKEREECARIAENGLVQVKEKAPYPTYLDAFRAIRSAIAEAIRSRSGKGGV